MGDLIPQFQNPRAKAGSSCICRGRLTRSASFILPLHDPQPYLNANLCSRCNNWKNRVFWHHICYNLQLYWQSFVLLFVCGRAYCRVWGINKLQWNISTEKCACLKSLHLFKLRLICAFSPAPDKLNFYWILKLNFIPKETGYGIRCFSDNTMTTVM